MKYLFYILLITFSLPVLSQNVSQNVISNAGNYYNSADFSVSWTVGQPVINTLESNNIIVTQGFQQSKFSISKIEENISNFDVKIFPNPASDFINVIVNTENNISLLLKILDINGHVVRQAKTGNNKESTINIKKLPESIYFIKVINKTDNTYNVYKLVKKNI
jgi:hypothetical protein